MFSEKIDHVIVAFYDILVYERKDDTIKHLIFAASQFGDFKRLTYWHSLILAILNLMPFKVDAFL